MTTTDNHHDTIQTLLEYLTRADTDTEIAYHFSRLYRNFNHCQFTNDQIIQLELIVQPYSLFMHKRYRAWTAKCYRILFMEEPDDSRNNSWETFYSNCKPHTKGV